MTIMERDQFTGAPFIKCCTMAAIYVIGFIIVKNPPTEPIREIVPNPFPISHKTTDK